MAREPLGSLGQPLHFGELPDPGKVSSQGARKPVILVAEDEGLLLNLITILMQEEGYSVLPVSDGRQGLEVSRSYPGRIDLVITDVQMPWMNGTDLCGYLLEERPGIKVLVMSGAQMGEIKCQKMQLPFLPKPFDASTLRTKVRALLNAPSLP